MIELRRATLGWYQAVLSPNFIAGVIAMVLIAAAIVCLASHYLFWNAWAQELFDYSGALAAFVFAVSGLSGLYGLLRAGTFHPALDYRYHGWLQASPWAPGQPLPKGPITPVWQDGLLLTLLTVLTAIYASQTENPTASALGPTIAMAAGLLIGWTAANFVTRNLVAVYGALFTAPAVGMLLFDLREAGFAIGLVAAAGVAYAGVVYGMTGYPWQLFPRDKNYMKRLLNPHEQRTIGWQTTAAIGWPYMQLLEPPKDFRVSRWRAAMESLTVFAIVSYAGRQMEFVSGKGEVVLMLVGQAGVGLVICKLIANLPLMCPRFCLGERLARWRPIVWRHDRLLLEPLLIGAAMAGIGSCWSWWDAGPLWLGAALTAAVGVWLTRRLGRPAAERFYTGPQSIRGVNPQAAFFKPLAAPGE